MRAAVLCLLASLAIAGPAAAQTAQPAYPAHGRADGSYGGMNPDNLPRERVDTPRQRPRPSGYWTGYRPGTGGAYRWRMLAIGIGVLAITALLVIRMLRRAPNRSVGRKRSAPVTS